MMVLLGVLLMVLKIALQDGFDAYRLLPPSLLLSEKGITSRHSTFPGFVSAGPS